jgi:transposase
MAYIIPQDRRQLFLHSCLDELVSPNHPVRILDAFVEEVFGPLLDREYTVGKRDTGRPAYSPRTLLKLYLYGYLVRIPSSRRLEVESQRNIELICLLQELSPDHKTIANFRSVHGELIQKAAQLFRQFLKGSGYIRGSVIGLDGTRVKANASVRRTMLTEERLRRRIQVAENQILEYLELLDRADTVEESGDGDEDFSEKEALLEEVARLRQQIVRLEAAQEIVESSDRSLVSQTDPEAPLMRTSEGKVPAYNVQMAVDDAHNLIASAVVTQDETDFEQLVPMLQVLETEVDIVPDVVLADTGYSDLGDIQAIQKKGKTRCFIPENDQPVRNRQVQFRYDGGTDRYICSEGRPLEALYKGVYNKRKNAYVDVYEGTECRTCAIAAACTSSKRGVRTLRVFHGAPWRESYRRQLASREGRAWLRMRKALVEHPFGTLKGWMGKIPLLLRGRYKVQTEIDIYTTVYNLKRLLTIDDFDEIMGKIRAFRLQMG